MCHISTLDEKDREATEEKNIIEKLTAEQKEWERKIKEQHKKMGGVHMSAAHTAKTPPQLAALLCQAPPVEIGFVEQPVLDIAA